MPGGREMNAAAARHHYPQTRAHRQQAAVDAAAAVRLAHSVARQLSLPCLLQMQATQSLMPLERAAPHEQFAVLLALRSPRILLGLPLRLRSACRWQSLHRFGEPVTAAAHPPPCGDRLLPALLPPCFARTCEVAARALQPLFLPAASRCRSPCTPSELGWRMLSRCRLLLPSAPTRHRASAPRTGEPPSSRSRHPGGSLRWCWTTRHWQRP